MLLRKLRILDFINPCTGFILFYLMFVVFGIVVSLWWPFDFVLDLTVSSKTMSIILIYLVVFYIASFLLSNIVSLKAPRQIETKVRLSYDPDNGRFLATLFWTLGVLFLAFFYLKTGYIPLLQEDVENARVAALEGRGRYVVLGNSLFFVSLMYDLGQQKVLKAPRKPLFYLKILISSLLLLGVGFRGPVAYLLLSLFLLNQVLSDQYAKLRSFPKKYILYGMLAMLVLSVYGFLRSYGHLSLSSLLFIFFTLAVNTSNLNYIVDYFPTHHDFFYGNWILSDLIAGIPGSQLKFSGDKIKVLLGMSFSGGPVTITAPGEGYLNFGMAGVVFHALFLGLFSGVLYNTLSRKDDLPSRILLILLCISIPRIVTGGFFAVFWFQFFPFFVIWVFFTCLARTNMFRFGAIS